MSERIKVELNRDIAKFQCLCTIPTLVITPSLAEEECAICKEDYQNHEWLLGKTVHRPVALPCGHILGFQCLARWMLSPTFDNRCFLCRAHIIQLDTKLSHELVLFVARLEILATFANKGITRGQKSQLLDTFETSPWGGKSLWPLSQNSDRMSDRIMVVWEMFLESLCTESAFTAGEGGVELVEPIGAIDQGQQNEGRAVVIGPFRTFCVCAAFVAYIAVVLVMIGKKERGGVSI